MPMRTKLALVFCLTFVSGISAQGQSRAQQTITAKAKDELLLASVSVLSDTQSVEFGPYLKDWKKQTETAWDRLVAAKSNAATLGKGAATIRLKLLPNGQIVNGSMVLESRTGNTGLDSAICSALSSSEYPPLPHEFRGRYLELRVVLSYGQSANLD